VSRSGGDVVVDEVMGRGLPSAIEEHDTFEPSSLEGPEQPKVFTRLSSSPMPRELAAGLTFILGILVSGLILLHEDQEGFLVWIREDGFVEWLTFAELLVMSVFSFMMSKAFSHSNRESAAERVWFVLGFLILFGALEEISWGQRIFKIESPAWFLIHNKQGEINVHNLVLYGVKINKLVFGKVLGILVGVYMLIVPLAYRVLERFRNLLDRWAIPVPQNYQILLVVIVTTLVQLHLKLETKAGELMELCNCFFFLLILMHPYNQGIFPHKGVRFWKKKAQCGR
jgi:hypothetical protein